MHPMTSAESIEAIEVFVAEAFGFKLAISFSLTEWTLLSRANAAR